MTARPALSHAARQEARSDKRLRGYLQGFSKDSEVLVLLTAIHDGLHTRPAATKAKQPARRATDSESSSEEAASGLLLELLCAGTGRSVEKRIRKLGDAQVEALKTAYWRCMHRCCGNDTVTERVLLAAPGQRLACMHALAAEAAGREAPLPAFLAELDAKERVLHYSSALAEPPRSAEEEQAVVAALRELLLDQARLLQLGCDMTWHHALAQAVRSYPRHAGPVLAAFLSDSLGLLLFSEPLKRVALEVLKCCEPKGAVARLGALLGEVAAQELRGCVHVSEGLEVALTLPKVLVKSMIGPGWRCIMRVWSEDPCAGDYLRCNHGVSVLLQCLERSAFVSRPFNAAGLSDDHVEYMELQATIVRRFVKALLADEVQAALVPALAWTTQNDIWTKKDQRRRLGAVLRHLAWTRWQVRLPHLLAVPLSSTAAEECPKRLGPQAPPLVLPLATSTGGDPAPPPGLSPVPTVKLVHRSAGATPSDEELEGVDHERVLALLEGARRAQEAQPIAAPWLDDAFPVQGVEEECDVASLGEAVDAEPWYVAQAGGLDWNAGWWSAHYDYFPPPFELVQPFQLASCWRGVP